MTVIWTLSSLYLLMNLQKSTLLECSITHITKICTFNSLYLLVLIQSAVLTERSIVGSLLQRKKQYYYFKKRGKNILLKCLYHETFSLPKLYQASEM